MANESNLPPVDARTVACTFFQHYIEPPGRRGLPAHTIDGQLVTHYWDETDRRGEDHINACSGIYPTGIRPDGTARYDGSVCSYDEGGPR